MLSMNTPEAKIAGLLMFAITLSAGCSDSPASEDTFTTTTTFSVIVANDNSDPAAEDGGEDGAALSPPTTQICLTHSEGGGTTMATMATACLDTQDGSATFTEEDGVTPGRYSVQVIVSEAGWLVQSQPSAIDVLDDEVEMSYTIVVWQETGANSLTTEEVTTAVTEALDEATSEGGSVETAVEEAIEEATTGSIFACTYDTNTSGDDLSGMMVEVQGDGSAETWATGDDGCVTVAGLPLHKALTVVVSDPDGEFGTMSVSVTITDATTPKPINFPMNPLHEVWMSNALPSLTVDETRDNPFGVYVNGSLAEEGQVTCTSDTPALVQVAEDCSTYTGVEAGDGLILVCLADDDTVCQDPPVAVEVTGGDDE